MKQKELMQTEFNLFKMNLSEQANTMSFKDFFEKIRKNPPEVASSGFKIWCPLTDLNRRPTAYKAVALPLS